MTKNRRKTEENEETKKLEDRKTYCLILESGTQVNQN